MASSPNTTRIICAGVSWWNHAPLRALLSGEAEEVVFRPTLATALALARPSRDRVYAWASRLDDDARSGARHLGVTIAAIEDGFVRSVGLGAGLARGGAYVVDSRGIYYDARRPSDIEVMLETNDVGDEECRRARDLVAAIVAARVSKYNVGRRRTSIAYPHGRARILVVGQVAADAGVRLTQSRTLDVSQPATVNRDLLRAARDEFLAAHIVYKPHPDVATGLRPGAVDREDLARCADAVVADVDIVDLIADTDRLVTLSSLSGFEALLRGKPVTTHGLPFYAGWGLTDDHTTAPRRTRRLDLDRLVAVALLRYCRYVDPQRLAPVTAEEMVAELARRRHDPIHRLAAGTRRRLSWVGRKIGL